MGWLLLGVVLVPVGAAALTLDQRLQLSRQQLETDDQGLTTAERREIRWARDSFSLRPSLRTIYRERQRARREQKRIESVLSLRAAVLALASHPDRWVEEEAERLSLTVVEAVTRGRGEFNMVRPAKWNNILVNLSLKNGGLCWQWTEWLFREIRQKEWRYFEPNWGVSRFGTLREHNALVITAPGVPFSHGLVVDPWRYAGRLYWERVDEDKYPWTPNPEAL